MFLQILYELQGRLEYSLIEVISLKKGYVRRRNSRTLKLVRLLTEVAHFALNTKNKTIMTRFRRSLPIVLNL